MSLDAVHTMSSWLQYHANSHRSQLTATAVISGAAVASAILGYQALRRREAVDSLKASIPDINDRHQAEKVCKGIICVCHILSKWRLIHKMKLTEYGSAASVPLSKEDERSAALAHRAQQGDYDEGNDPLHMLFASFSL